MNSVVSLSFNHLIQRLDNFIFESFKIKSEYLGLYRILYCLASVFIYGIPNFSWLDNNLNYMFLPPEISIASLFNGFPDKIIFTLLSIGVAILYLMLLFGWHTKRVSLLLFFSLLFGTSFTYSFGKIDHSILWLIIPLTMAFSGWGNSFSLDAKLNNKSPENAWAISLMVLLIGFAMFSASLPKVHGGWLSFDSSATKGHIIYNYFSWGRRPLLLDQVLQVKSAFFWEMLDYLTVIFEFGFLLAILSPIVFRVFIIGAIFFHVSIFLTLQISFTINLLTYLLFVNWSIFNPLIRSDNFKNFVTRFFDFKYLALLIGAVLIYGIVTTIVGVNFEIPSITGIVAKYTSITLRDINTFVLFPIALVITFASIFTYLRKQAVTHNYRLKVSAQ